MIKDGKKPIETKKPLGTKKFIFSPRNQLDVPPDLVAELRGKGLQFRWLDSKSMASNGNLHRNQWSIYVVSDPVERSKKGYLAADGTVRSGTLVLGVRDEEIGVAHKEYLQEKADRYLKSTKAARQEIAREARKEGFKVDDESEEKKI